MNHDVMMPPEWLEPSVHSSYLALLLRHSGLPASDINRLLGETPHMLSFLEAQQTFQMSRKASTNVQPLAFGYDTALDSHGMVGQAIIASANLNQAMEVMVRYKPTRNNALTYHWHSAPKDATVTVAPRFDLGEHSNDLVCMSLLSMVRAAVLICGREILDELELTLPSHNEGIDTPLPIDLPHLHWSASTAAACFTVPAKWASIPNILANDRQFRLANLGCEEELNLLEGRTTDKVKKLAVNAHADSWGLLSKKQWRSLDEIATCLCISKRTLIRQLDRENTSYSEIMDAIRSELACWYLSNTHLPIAEISHTLGYTDDSNFSRTFRRWHAMTPREYRRSLSR